MVESRVMEEKEQEIKALRRIADDMSELVNQQKKQLVNYRAQLDEYINLAEVCVLAWD